MVKKTQKLEPWKHYQKKEKQKRHWGVLTRIIFAVLLLLIISSSVLIIRWSLVSLNPVKTSQNSWSRMENPKVLFLLKINKGKKIDQAYLLLEKNETGALLEIPTNLLLRSGDGFFELGRGILDGKNWLFGLEDFWSRLANGYLIANSESFDWPKFFSQSREARITELSGQILPGGVSSNLNPWELGKVVAGFPHDFGLETAEHLVTSPALKTLTDDKGQVTLILNDRRILADFVNQLFAKSINQNSLNLTALIYNVSASPGLASDASQYLANLDIAVLETGNRGPCSKAPFCDNQLIIYRQPPKSLVDNLEKVFQTKAIYRLNEPNSRADVEVLVGRL